MAGLGFLAAIFSAAIAPASISTAIATAIASLHLKALFIFQKQKKQKKTRLFYLPFTLVSFFCVPAHPNIQLLWGVKSCEILR